MNTSSPLLRVVRVVGPLAVALWVFGFATLGAVVAPIVFRVVPAPWSADAMTLVFARFDKVALVAAAVATAGELLRAQETGRIPWGRRGALAGAFAARLYGALALTPAIAGLHAAGAVRLIGPDGLLLEAIHKRAELLAKGEVWLGFAYLLLHLVPLTVPAPSARAGGHA